MPTDDANAESRAAYQRRPVVHSALEHIRRAAPLFGSSCSRTHTHTHLYRDTLYIFLCAAWDLDLVVLLVRGLSVVNATIELLRIDPSMAEYRCYTICGGYRLSAKAKANAKSQSKSLQTQLQMLRPRRNSPDYSVNLVTATASAAATV